MFGPAFAIETVKGRSWRKEWWNSSAKSAPQIDSPASAGMVVRCANRRRNIFVQAKGSL